MMFFKNISINLDWGWGKVMIEITEKDLYKFVFYPEQLSDEKRDYIISNYSVYEDLIDELNSYKDNLDLDVSDEILENINEKIDAAQSEDTIVLSRIERNANLNQLRIAADSPRPSEYTRTETFVDPDNQFLAKVIQHKERTKVFILPKDETGVFEIKLTLFPSNEVYHTNIKDMPLILDPIQNINSIHLSIQ
jgi:hypothetical protein